MARMVRSYGVTWATLGLVALSRGRGRRGYGLDVLNNCADLLRLEVKAEARHARRAVADIFADKFFVPAERLARQYGSVLPGPLLNQGVADAAGLAEQAQPLPLGIIERCIGRALSENAGRRGNHESRSQNPSSHCFFLRLFEGFLRAGLP